MMGAVPIIRATVFSRTVRLGAAFRAAAGVRGRAVKWSGGVDFPSASAGGRVRLLRAVLLW